MVTIKPFGALLKADLSRALFSFNFLAMIILIMVVMFISSFGFMTESSDVVGLLSHALTGSGSNLFIYCIAPVIPYGMAFAIDVEEKVSPFWIIRTGTNPYASSKFLAAVLAGFLLVAISIIAFSLGMSLFFPLFVDVSAGDSYSMLLVNHQPILYVIAIATHYGLSAVLFAGGGLAISTFIPNKFSTVALPIVIYFVYLRSTGFAALPTFLDPTILVQSIYPNVTPLAAFLYKLVPVSIILAILFVITVKQITKKVGTT